MERLWQWGTPDRCERERCRRQRAVYHYLRQSVKLVERVISNNKRRARLSNEPNFVIHILSLYWPVSTIRHINHPQVTSPNIFSIASSDCYFLSIIIAAYLRSSFAVLLWSPMHVCTDSICRLWCGSGGIGVLLYVHLYFRINLFQESGVV